MDQIQKSTIRHMARGDCSDPSYPGPSSDEHSSKVLEEIIIKLNEFLKNKLLMDGTLLEGELKNITFFIGARSKIGLWGGIRLYANVCMCVCVCVCPTCSGTAETVHKWRYSY